MAVARTHPAAPMNGSKTLMYLMEDLKKLPAMALNTMADNSHTLNPV